MPEFADHFSARAADYAAFRPTYPKALIDLLATLPSGRGRALDPGCGTGQLSVLLAGRFDEVIATDASASQIAEATPHPRIRYHCAPAESIDLPDRSVDLITVAQAAHWFDLGRFYPEARRVLRPDGALALISYGVVVLDGAPGEVMARFYHHTLAPFWPAERRHVEAGYRTLPFPFREEAAPPLAMQARWRAADLLGYVDTWSAMRRMEAAEGRAAFDRFAADLTAAWGAPDAPREIRWPISLRIGRP